MMGSIFGNMLGFSSWSITNPSAILDKVDVSDIGLKSLLKSVVLDVSGMGDTLAVFHIYRTHSYRMRN